MYTTSPTSPILFTIKPKDFSLVENAPIEYSFQIKQDFKLDPKYNLNNLPKTGKYRQFNILTKEQFLDLYEEIKTENVLYVINVKTNKEIAINIENIIIIKPFCKSNTWINNSFKMDELNINDLN